MGNLCVGSVFHMELEEDLEVMGHLCIGSVCVYWKNIQIDDHHDDYRMDAVVFEHDVVMVMVRTMILMTLMMTMMMMMMMMMMVTIAIIMMGNDDAL